MKYIDEGKYVDAKGWSRWVTPKRRGYRMACCDCGLVHEMNFRKVGIERQKIQFQVRRHERATAAMRRGKKK